ncbi:MAG: phosphomannomutase, partial [Planctomycetes bacterium]|nr:phosphomannomutase [Planctomycetota bacterium]
METQKEERIACFKAYDVRGRIPDELDEDLVYRIGRGYAAEVEPKGAIAVGRDIRLSSQTLSRALIRGLNEGGADVVDIGLCGTEMVYFAASLEGMGGGIMVTASHNPRDYNGMKFVREGARPISGDSGLLDIEARVRMGRFGGTRPAGTCRARDILAEYIDRLLSFVDRRTLRPLTIVTNPGNGCAGPPLDALAPSLPFRFVRIQHQPDGNFPNGIPNPLIAENR